MDEQTFVIVELLSQLKTNIRMTIKSLSIVDLNPEARIYVTIFVWYPQKHGQKIQCGNYAFNLNIALAKLR